MNLCCHNLLMEETITERKRNLKEVTYLVDDDDDYGDDDFDASTSTEDKDALPTPPYPVTPSMDVSDADALAHFERLGFRYYPDAIKAQNLRDKINEYVDELLSFKDGRVTRSAGPVPFNAKYGRECWLASKIFNKAVLDPVESVLRVKTDTGSYSGALDNSENRRLDRQSNGPIQDNAIKVWDRNPADSYKNKIPENTPLLDDSPSLLRLDKIARTLGDEELASERLYLVQVITHYALCFLGCKKKDSVFSDNVMIASALNYIVTMHSVVYHGVIHHGTSNHIALIIIPTQVVKYEGNTTRGSHQDDLPNAGHIIVGYTAGCLERSLELHDFSAQVRLKITLAPGSMYIMKNSVRYGNKLSYNLFGHGKIEHNAIGKSSVLVLRYGKPRPQDVRPAGAKKPRLS